MARELGVSRSTIANSALAGEPEDGIPETKDGLKDPVHIACVQRLVLDRATNAQHAIRIIAGLGGRLFGITCADAVLHYLVSEMFALRPVFDECGEACGEQGCSRSGRG